MALKPKISKDEHGKLSADLKALYTPEGDDYVLEIDGYTANEDIGELSRAKARLKAERDEASEELTALKEKVKNLEAAAGAPEPDPKETDVKVISKSYEDKLAEQTKAHKAEMAALNKSLAATQKAIADNLMNTTAEKIAGEISNSPNLILPHVLNRLVVDTDGDTPVIKVLDKNGNESGKTIDNLKKEFVDNKDFASIITSSKAQGSGASSAGQKSSTAVPTERKPSQSAEGDKPLNLGTASPQDLVAHLDAQDEAQEA